jgi:hypothetical protein
VNISHCVEESLLSSSLRECNNIWYLLCSLFLVKFQNGSRNNLANTHIYMYSQLMLKRNHELGVYVAEREFSSVGIRIRGRDREFSAWIRICGRDRELFLCLN